MYLGQLRRRQPRGGAESETLAPVGETDSEYIKFTAPLKRVSIAAGDFKGDTKRSRG
jgi:hypothetical protein